MRIAALLSGMPRYVDKGQILMKDFFKGHEVDYFVHGWFDPEKTEEQKSWHNFSRTIDKEIPEKITKHYNPKLMILEPQRKFEIKKDYKYNTGWPQPYFICYSHFYSCKMVNELRKKYERDNNVKYDMVVRMRFDMYIGCKIDWDGYDLNNLYLPDNCNVWTELYDDVQFNDMFAFSKPENMDVYFSVFDRIDEIYSTNHLRFSCENFLAYVLLESDINVIPMRFNRSFLLRDTETYDLHFGFNAPSEQYLVDMCCHNDETS